MTTDAQIDYLEKERFQKKLKWAEDYLNYGVKMGIYDEEEIEKMSPLEKIIMADSEEFRAQYEYSVRKDEGRLDEE